MTDEQLMEQARFLAKQAALEGEVPVGAVVAKDGEIVGTGRNRREKEKNALAHAELEAIHTACQTLGGWRLSGCDLFVTLEPCPMCAGAIINARLRRVVYGAYDPKAGAAQSVLNLFVYPFNHRPEVTGGFMQEDCAALLQSFFKQLRSGGIAVEQKRLSAACGGGMVDIKTTKQEQERENDC